MLQELLELQRWPIEIFDGSTDTPGSVAFADGHLSRQLITQLL